MIKCPSGYVILPPSHTHMHTYYRMGLNFRGTKLSQFSRFGGHPRIV